MHPVDWIVLLGYAAAILVIGWRVSRGQKTADGHLRANRDLPAWAVVFSVLAAEISAATYIGVPESAYRRNWNYMQFAIGALLGKWVLATFFVRLYWRLNLPTVYGFLGQRIGPLTQRAAAWAFLAGRLIATGVRLFIAAQAFAVVTGTSMTQAILLMTAISTAYTFVGGLKAVVWTDVAQGCVFTLGAVTAVAVGLWKLGLPIGDVVREAYDAGKLQFITFQVNDGETWLTSSRPLPLAMLAGFFLVLASHGTDQEAVQHMLNTRNEKSSGRTVFLSGLFTFPIVAAFLSVGTVLSAYYRRFRPVGYSLETNDDIRRVFPNFILHEMPIGVRGLVFAGLFAATIGVLGATLNAVTAAWANDIMRRSDAGPRLRTVKALNVAFGVALAGIALFFAWTTRGSSTALVEVALQSMTIVYGGVLGTFLVALLVGSRGSEASTVAGMAAGVAVGAFLNFHDRILGLDKPILSWPYYLPIGVAVTMGVAMLGRRESPPAPAR